MSDHYTTDLFIEEVTIGDTGPTITVEDISRVDIAKYAGASGDFNPIHLDDTYARNAGNDGVIAHGMLTASIASHMVADWFGLTNVERLRTRFATPVYPGDTLTVSGEITGKTGTEVTADIGVTNQKGDKVLTGDVTASLPSLNSP